MITSKGKTLEYKYVIATQAGFTCLWLCRGLPHSQGSCGLGLRLCVQGLELNFIFEFVFGKWSLMGQGACVLGAWSLSSFVVPSAPCFSGIDSQPSTPSLFCPDLASSFIYMSLFHHCCCPLPRMLDYGDWVCQQGRPVSTFTLLPWGVSAGEERVRGQYVPHSVLWWGQEKAIPDQAGSTIACLPVDSVEASYILRVWRVQLFGVSHLPSISMLNYGKGRLTFLLCGGPTFSFCTGRPTNYIAGSISTISCLTLYIINA